MNKERRFKRVKFTALFANAPPKELNGIAYKGLVIHREDNISRYTVSHSASGKRVGLYALYLVDARRAAGRLADAFDFDRPVEEFIQEAEKAGVPSAIHTLNKGSMAPFTLKTT